MANNNSLQKTNVTLKMLLDTKILSQGQQIFCTKPDIHGILNEDGSITIIIEGKQKGFDFLSGAARHIEKRSLNGWTYWWVVVNGEKYSLDGFRDQYLKTQSPS
ncbi:hypothetical protein V7S65_20990 [Chitinophaga sp. CCNWYY40]